MACWRDPRHRCDPSAAASTPSTGRQRVRASWRAAAVFVTASFSHRRGVNALAVAGPGSAPNGLYGREFAPTTSQRGRVLGRAISAEEGAAGLLADAFVFPCSTTRRCSSTTTGVIERDSDCGRRLGPVAGPEGSAATADRTERTERASRGRLSSRTAYASSDVYSFPSFFDTETNPNTLLEPWARRISCLCVFV